MSSFFPLLDKFLENSRAETLLTISRIPGYTGRRVKTSPKFAKCIFYVSTVFIIGLHNQNVLMGYKGFHVYKWHNFNSSYMCIPDDISVN